jgi:hypothetical protein
VVFWGLVACSFPMALIWHTLNREEPAFSADIPAYCHSRSCAR